MFTVSCNLSKYAEFCHMKIALCLLIVISKVVMWSATHPILSKTIGTLHFKDQLTRKTFYYMKFISKFRNVEIFKFSQSVMVRFLL